MPEISLRGDKGKGLVTTLDQDDYEKYVDKKIYLDIGYAKLFISDDQRKRFGVFLHRLIMNAPKGIHIDHINHDKLDNRKGNLRLVTQQQNHWNRSPIGKYKNIWKYSDNSWWVAIEINRVILYKELFDNEIDAAHAADWAMIKYQGEYANLNFKEFDYTNYIPNPKMQDYTSQYQNVWFCKRKNRWISGVYIDGKRKSVGSYDTEDDAAMSRDLYIIKNNLEDKLCKPDYPYTLDMEIKTTGQSTKKCKYIGVIPERNKYAANISIGGKTRYIGSFFTQEDAAIARDKYIIENGINKKLTFPQPDA